MIAVIADDLTGAAELAGIGLRFGLKTMLTRGDESVNDVDLWIACSDSRSLTEAEARVRTRRVAENILAVRPAWIFQKTDSVLRGHVLAELRILMELTGNRQAVLSPANPTLGRTIREGNYYVNDIPVHLTGFAADPEFPVYDADIYSMLRLSQSDTDVRCSKDTMLQEGITIAEAGSLEDVLQWAATIKRGTLQAGGSDFFAALLQQHYVEQPAVATDWNQPVILVSGTRYPTGRQEWRAPVCELPLSKELPDGWLQEAKEKWSGNDKLIIAFEEGDTSHSAASLRKYMAEVVHELIRPGAMPELIIEGGATAAAILDELNETQLQPLEDLARGVVRLQGLRACYTFKPGSYTWPEKITDWLQ